MTLADIVMTLVWVSSHQDGVVVIKQHFSALGPSTREELVLRHSVAPNGAYLSVSPDRRYLALEIGRSPTQEGKDQHYILRYEPLSVVTRVETKRFMSAGEWQDDGSLLFSTSMETSDELTLRLDRLGKVSEVPRKVRRASKGPIHPIFGARAAAVLRDWGYGPLHSDLLGSRPIGEDFFRDVGGFGNVAADGKFFIANVPRSGEEYQYLVAGRWKRNHWQVTEIDRSKNFRQVYLGKRTFITEEWEKEGLHLGHVAFDDGSGPRHVEREHVVYDQSSLASIFRFRGAAFVNIE